MSSLSLFLSRRLPCIHLSSMWLFPCGSVYEPGLIVPTTLVFPVVANSTMIYPLKAINLITSSSSSLPSSNPYHLRPPSLLLRRDRRPGSRAVHPRNPLPWRVRVRRCQHLRRASWSWTSWHRWIDPKSFGSSARVNPSFEPMR